MARPSTKLRDDALRIWHTGLEAVRSERLMKECVWVDDRTLVLANHSGEELQIDLNAVSRIFVVGAGKAGAGMAAALEEILGPELMAEKEVVGWINVPADCVPPQPNPLLGEGGPRIHLHAARP